MAVSDQDAATFTTQRTRLSALFSNKWIKTSLVLQDVRRWGNQPQLVGNEDYAVSVHQAWAEVVLSEEW